MTATRSPHARLPRLPRVVQEMISLSVSSTAKLRPKVATTRPEMSGEFCFGGARCRTLYRAPSELAVAGSEFEQRIDLGRADEIILAPA
ncbi:MAG: hypothetical protein ABW205_09115 [Burkholderiales bacterium]